MTFVALWLGVGLVGALLGWFLPPRVEWALLDERERFETVFGFFVVTLGGPLGLLWIVGVHVHGAIKR